LKALGIGIDQILNFGIFSFLSRLFLNILIMFYSFTGNYGVAIIMLTMVLQVFIFPLSRKSFKSMQSMKELQPKINNLRTKYKDDPSRMNQEMMIMYKKYKVNPLSGCFPMLLQMPIFISLFTMLRGATELRYAGFLWIKDLAKADILFSTIPVLKGIPVIGGAGPLPFLMGGAMLLQQTLTGGMEGPQKSMMYMMPIMFTFLFIKFPSGLVLYWLTNSILTYIVQSSLMRKDQLKK
jgi:YidC/Oxa1 family membrane protein insertase